MFENPAFDRVRRLFADQFEPDGADFLYRKSMKGAPIRVSASERDRFVEAFNRSIKFRIWGLVGGLIVLCMALAFYAAAAHSTPSNTVLYSGFGAILAAYMAAHYWTWNAPLRELQGRSTLGPARSRAEMRRLLLAKMTYREIAGVAGTALIVLFQINRKQDLLAGRNLLCLILAAIILVLAAAQALRKWRYDAKQTP
jgi:hypothetical protein